MKMLERTSSLVRSSLRVRRPMNAYSPSTTATEIRLTTGAMMNMETRQPTSPMAGTTRGTFMVGR